MEIGVLTPAVSGHTERFINETLNEGLVSGKAGFLFPGVQLCNFPFAMNEMISEQKSC